jgi:sulfopyruvate decarboxylase subunit alpha
MRAPRAKPFNHPAMAASGRDSSRWRVQKGLIRVAFDTPVSGCLTGPSILPERHVTPEASSEPRLSSYSPEVAAAIAEECAAARIELVASLPDDWIAPTIAAFESDSRFRHVPVNREEAAIGLCSGAFFAGQGALALMGASGLMTVIYAITKINYTYEIPVLILATQRGSMDDGAKFHVSNGLYLQQVMQAIDLPNVTIDSRDKLPLIGEAYAHSRKISRPTVAVLSRKLLQGIA